MLLTKRNKKLLVLISIIWISMNKVQKFAI